MLLHNAPFLQSIRVSGSHLAQCRSRGLRSPQPSGVRASLEVQQSATMSSSKEMLQKYRDRMAMQKPDMERVRDDFVDQMRAGLAEDGGSTLPMIPTLVDILPDGHEHGKFFSIDLGGTNLRCAYVKLPRDHAEVDVVEYEENPIPEEMRHCPAEELFDYIVDKLLAFAEKVHWFRPGRRKMILGFCFSFPTQQTAIDHGTLIKWVKGFTNPGAEGQDVMKLLRDAFHRKQLTVEVTALVNDAVGTLASAQYGDAQHNTDTCISIIVGTGTNCCYLEQLSNIPKYQHQFLPRTSDMVINTEWADYTSDCLPWLTEDRELDADSRYPGSHHFEKMTAGLYMGNLARLIILRLAREGGLFGGSVPPMLQEECTLSTPQMELIHEDMSDDRHDVAAILQEQFEISAEQAPLDVRLQVQEVCQLVAVRGARLTAAAIAGMLRHLGRDDRSGPDAPRNVVAVEGAVLRKYTAYRTEVQTAAEELMGKASISIEPAPVLSGTLGAALVAAAAKNYMSGLSFYEH